jgi:hypothetical protein
MYEDVMTYTDFHGIDSVDNHLVIAARKRYTTELGYGFSLTPYT